MVMTSNTTSFLFVPASQRGQVSPQLQQPVNIQYSVKIDFQLLFSKQST
jgi:hypothetical protein